ncbi:protein kinase [Streptomyces globisporus]|uniref:protein kinase domain-containing protein n=1 Tax=Streptomyces TaxID=1883 RepID=UPI00116109F1|nr:protein kinase [Streptomyces sp. TSRI0445]
MWRKGAVIDDRYKVTGLLGQGGMGVVHQIRHLAWGVDLAVKSPKAERWNDSGRKHFVREAETWVSLGLHPHVCSCYYVRTLDGVPRVFVEYVPGGSLHDWIRNRELYRGDRHGVLARILDLAIQFAWGLEHAHSRNLVHQDVKPQNVLVEAAGQGTVTAKVTDFGLARARAVALVAAGDDTAPDVSVPVTTGGMTLRYASPEQGSGRPLGRRTDIYSYAVSVLEMFTGEATWRIGEAAGVALSRYRTQTAGARPDEHLPDMPPDLADLLERCLDHDPVHRPGSMSEIAAELTRIYQKVLGYPYPRRIPQAAELLADEYNNKAMSLLDLERTDEAEEAFTEALSVDPRHVPATYNRGLLRWRRGETTDEALVAALDTLRGDTGDPWQSRLALAHVHLERGDVTTAREVLDSAVREQPGEPEILRAWKAVTSGRVTDARPAAVATVPWYADARRRMEESRSSGQRSGPAPELQIRLTGGARRALTACDGSVRFWDTLRGSCMRTLDRGRASHAADVSPDGRYAVAVGTDEIVRLWDLADGSCVRTFTPQYLKGTTAIRSTRLTAVADRVAAATDDGQVLVWDTGTGRVIRTVEVYEHGDTAFALASDGHILLTAGHQDGSVRLWDVDSGDVRQVLPGFGDASEIRCVFLTTDGRRAATVGHKNAIALWDLDTGRCVSTLAPRTTAARAMALSTDCRWVFCDGREGGLEWWDLEHGRCLRTFRGHVADVLAVQIADDGRTGVSAGKDDTAIWWRLPGDYDAPPMLSRPRPATELSRLSMQVMGLVAEAQEARKTGQYAQALHLLTRARALPGHERSLHVLSAWRALGRCSTRVGVRAGWASRVVARHGDGDQRVALSADGRSVAWGLEHAIHVRDIASGNRKQVIDTSGHRSRFWGLLTKSSLKLSADGQRVMQASARVDTWSVETGEHISGFEPGRGAQGARFSDDGRFALLVAGDESLQLWDLDSGERVRTLAERGHHPAGPRALWLAPDGCFAASCASDRVIRLWDLSTGACLREFRGHTSDAQSICVSNDMRFLLSCGSNSDRTIRLWDVSTGELVRVFEELSDEADGSGWHRTARFTSDGRFAISGASKSSAAVWDVTTGRRLHVMSEDQSGLIVDTLSSDGCHALSIGVAGEVRLWELDWELAARAPADWDASAEPYVRRFLERHGAEWPSAVDDLLRRLQDAGYGWLRPDGVRAQADRMASRRN